MRDILPKVSDWRKVFFRGLKVNIVPIIEGEYCYIVPIFEGEYCSNHCIFAMFVYQCSNIWILLNVMKFIYTYSSLGGAFKLQMKIIEKCCQDSFELLSDSFLLTKHQNVFLFCIKGDFLGRHLTTNEDSFCPFNFQMRRNILESNFEGWRIFANASVPITKFSPQVFFSFKQSWSRL